MSLGKRTRTVNQWDRDITSRYPRETLLWRDRSIYILFGDEGLEKYKTHWAIFSTDSAKADKGTMNLDYAISASSYESDPNDIIRYSYDLERISLAGEQYLPKETWRIFIARKSNHPALSQQGIFIAARTRGRLVEPTNTCALRSLTCASGFISLVNCAHMHMRTVCEVETERMKTPFELFIKNEGMSQRRALDCVHTNF